MVLGYIVFYGGNKLYEIEDFGADDAIYFDDNFFADNINYLFDYNDGTNGGDVGTTITYEGSKINSTATVTITAFLHDVYIGDVNQGADVSTGEFETYNILQ